RPMTWHMKMNNLLEGSAYAIRDLARSRVVGTATALALAIPCVTSAQGAAAAPTVLTMDQAVSFAHQNNPDFLTARNNRRNASVELRSAYGALLPQLSASLSGQYQQGGQQFFNGVSLSSSSDVMQSQYQIGLNYRIN